jgi:bleomycin hydrolase
MKTKFLTLTVALGAAASCMALGSITGSDGFGHMAFCSPDVKDTTAVDSTGFNFKDIKTIKTTSVKDQNKSGTCWCFAGTSFFEDEIIRQGGDSLDLSEMFTVRHCYDEKGQKYVRYYGQTNFGPGGSLLDVPYIWEKYGAVPEEAYAGLNYGEDKHVHGELDGILLSMLNVVKSKPNKKISTAWQRAYDGVLDAYLGQLPETFKYKGKTYTPKSFAASLPIKPENYIAISSFTHHPFYQNFTLDVPDNWLNGQYMNLPLDEMKRVVDNALENGYPVAWAADVSEGGFKWKEGVALMPKDKDVKSLEGTELSRWVKLSDKERDESKFEFTGPVEELTVTQEMRQEMYDNQETTDDHGMEIVGIAVDRLGNRYYKVKNSWDTNQIYDGFIYVSEPYFLAKTMGIYVNREALPKDIAKKINKK